MFPQRFSFCLLLILLGCGGGEPGKPVAQNNPSPLADTGGILLNQLGFYVTGPKLALVPGSSSASEFKVIDGSGREVFRGALGTARTWPFSETSVRLADFGDLQMTGTFKLVVADVGESYAFDIASRPMGDLVSATLKAFYLNRCSTAIEEHFAPGWSRPMGHPDTEVIVHGSAAGPVRAAGSTITAPGGWYDAGDYNKYIVNSGIATYSLLAAYAHRPGYFDSLTASIPEADNDLPDILDEALYNVRWMLSMQDPDDGAVYHKLTTLNFEGYVMPHQALMPRYVVGKSTSATLDFAATLALAARILQQWPAHREEANRFLDAATRAWSWARQHPERHYVQPDDVHTGTYAYADEAFGDEFFWASIELFLSTGDAAYLASVSPAEQPAGVPSWDYVAPLGWLSLAYSTQSLPQELAELARQRVLDTAMRLVDQAESSAFRVAMGTFPQRHMVGQSEADFSWGSNGVAGYQGMMLLAAFHLTDEAHYLNAALANLDYLLGRNPTGYCFVTGLGDRSPQDPHQRLSMGDEIGRPLPGFLVGGPHAGQQDAGDCPTAIYPSDKPALSYIDHHCSYATNEVAINWNAPLVYLAGHLDAIYGR